MPEVSTVSTSGDAYIDGLLGGLEWAATSLTFSFPTSGSYYGTSYGYGENANNFGVLNLSQQATARFALDQYASVSHLKFAEIAETRTQHADMRFGMSDEPSTAWAYMPGTYAEAGDAWFNSSSGYYSSPQKGNYAFTTFLHEIGHALGLEHPHEAGMPADRDSMEYTVMSYRSYVGAPLTGYPNESGGFAQSLMMYDIAAIQHLYGANFRTNSGDTIYGWSPITGEFLVNGVGQGAPAANRIFQTVWDGGGTDTYDFSSYTTALTVDLQPGGWTTTSTTQLAKLQWDGSEVAAGNVANALQYNNDPRSLIENAKGGSGNDSISGNEAGNDLWGNAGDDHLWGGAGTDWVDGGGGFDFAVFSGPKTAVSWVSFGGKTVVASSEGLDHAVGVEGFQFTDQSVTLRDNALDYIASYSDLRDAFGVNAQAGADHFQSAGATEGRSVMFDGLEYLATYEDLRDCFGTTVGAAALATEHFIYAGAFEGRKVDFEGLEYIASYADLREAFGLDADQGTLHYLASGIEEGRQAGFDALEYIASHGDLIRVIGTDREAGASHFISYGAAEGRQDTFDPDAYLTKYADLGRAFGADIDLATQHFIEYGFYEGRSDDLIAV